jgi:tRNA(adenine34) deaminase
MTDTHYMQRAIALAEQALQEGDLPVGAIVVYNNEIIGSGRRAPHQDTRLDHAEMVALREASAHFGMNLPRGVTVYTTLEPCMKCAGAMLNAKVERVVYALEDPYGGACNFFNQVSAQLPVRHRDDVMTSSGGVLREEVRNLFAQFFSTTTNEFWTSHPENPLYKMVMD